MAVAEKSISVILIALLATLVLQAIQPILPDLQNMSFHVIEKRGLSNAERASKCNSDPDAVEFFNPYTGRYGKVCNLPGIGWFVVILDGAGRIITAFPKEKLSNLTQVMHYMSNAGYSLR